VSNPAQNRRPCPVIVKQSEIRTSSEKPGEGEMNGTVSSVSPSAAGVRTGIRWIVAGDI